jgi:hypothetical protein
MEIIIIIIIIIIIGAKWKNGKIPFFKRGAVLDEFPRSQGSSHFFHLLIKKKYERHVKMFNTNIDVHIEGTILNWNLT